MWHLKQTQLSSSTSHYCFQQFDGTTLSFRDVLDLWRSEEGQGPMFRLFTCLTLASSPFGAFRFETPPVSQESLDRIFEFVLVDSSSLDRKQSHVEFSSHFESSSSEQTVLRFANLRGDAILVVPRPGKDPHINHSHLGAFLRTADQSTCLELWRQVGLAVCERLDERLDGRPLWLNTAGAGVAWLHVRIDDSPKYYVHAPFKK